MNNLKSTKCFLAVCLLCFVLQLNAQNSTRKLDSNVAQITLHVNQKIGTVNPWIYGQFLEHINYTADLGLHAELLAERSFEMSRLDIPDMMSMPGALRPGLDPTFPAFLWSATYQKTADPLEYRTVAGKLPESEVIYRLMEGKSNKIEYGVVDGQLGIINQVGDYDLQVVNGIRYMRLQISKNQPQTEGVRQEFVPSKKEEVLDGFIYLRASGKTPSVEVGLRKRGGGEVYASASINNITNNWAKYKFTLKPEKEDLDAEFFVGSSKAGIYDIDMVSLMPLKNRKGLPFREDLLEAVKALKPSIIRWPGGAFVHVYDWKAGIGPYDQRQPIRGATWGDGGETEPSTFGTDEFLTWCHMVGAEPLLVINVKYGVSDALNWIEYCNGPVTSIWGAKRAANGYPEPWNVTCWSLDNERWAMGVDAYSNASIEIADSIAAKYPNFKIWAVGTGQPFERLQDPKSRALWGPNSIKKMAGRVDFCSFHDYFGKENAENIEIEEVFKTEKKLYDQYSPNRKVMIAFDEWMPDNALNLVGGLSAAMMFNSMERCWDKVSMAAPAPLFWHQRLGTAWYGTLIHHDHAGWFPTPVYVVNKLWAEHRAPNLVKTNYNGPHLSVQFKRQGKGQIDTTYENVPSLDISTTTEPKDGRIVLKVVNRNYDTDIKAIITIEGKEPSQEASCYTIYCDKLEASNTMTMPDEVKVEKSTVNLKGKVLEHVFLKHSAVLIEFKKSN